jgi:uncharacterized protein (DUF885 family)
MDHYWYDSEAIHELGLKEVARLTAEMENKTQGFKGI